MTSEALTMAVIIFITLVLSTQTKHPFHSFLGGVLAAWWLGLAEPVELFSGFINPAVITVGSLYVVAAGIRHTGALDGLLDFWLKRSVDSPGGYFRFLPWVTAVSSLINNTPVVGILIGPLEEWCRRTKTSPSKLLLPLSYAASLGGMLTILGTSTNLVVSELLVEAGAPRPTLFSVGKLGLPCALVGLVFMALMSGRLLPDRAPQEFAALPPEPRRKERAVLSLILLFFMVALAITGKVPLMVGAVITGTLMVLTRCCSLTQARRAVDWPILVLMGCALGLARAAEVSGLAAAMAGMFTAAGDGSIVPALVSLYGATWLLTEFLTNSAAAALMFPIAAALAKQLNLDLLPLALMIMVAASSSFVTPYGNQTNLMVYRPGGYKLADYARIGLPMALLMAVTALTSTYLLL